MYRILFIDEEVEDTEIFEDFFEANDRADEFQVISHVPLPTLEETVDLFIEIKPDALVTDFKLNDIKEQIQYNVPYNGVDLMEAITKKFMHFPCFVMTSFDDLAINESEDVNYIYVKGDLHEQDQGKKVANASFSDRVKAQINKYKRKIEESGNRVVALIKKQNSAEGIDAYEEEELLNLDDFLEKTLDSSNRVPFKLKEHKESDNLIDLLGKVENLLNKFDDE